MNYPVPACLSNLIVVGFLVTHQVYFLLNLLLSLLSRIPQHYILPPYLARRFSDFSNQFLQLLLVFRLYFASYLELNQMLSDLDPGLARIGVLFLKKPL
jgi:hypothetical protein